MHPIPLHKPTLMRAPGDSPSRRDELYGRGDGYFWEGIEAARARDRIPTPSREEQIEGLLKWLRERYHLTLRHSSDPASPPINREITQKKVRALAKILSKPGIDSKALTEFRERFEALKNDLRNIP